LTLTRAILCAAAAALLAPALAGASTYSSPTRIALPAPGSPSDVGAGSPYPSTISVTGLPGTVSKARVTLHGVRHQAAHDVAAVLVGPGGQKVNLVESQCSGILTGLTFTFDDAAPAPLPDSEVCPSGTYKPAPPSGSNLYPPGPPGPYSSALSVLSGGSPNGNWQLWAADYGGGDTGAIDGGWSLDLLPTVACAGRTASAGVNVGTAGDDVLTGTAGPDVLLGLGGKDKIRGLAGKDVICGGAGKDKLIGGAGKDKLRGEGGIDTCKGGKSRDSARSCEKRRSI